MDHVLTPKSAAVAALIAALLLMLLGAAGGVAPARAPATSGPTDIGLYQFEIAAAHHPSTYYATVTAEERREGYPLKPFVTVRPPALAFLLATLPGEGARRVALDVLALAVLAAWAMRLRAEGFAPVPLVLGLIVLASGLLTVTANQAYAMHETWAGLLIALSLALRRPDRWGLALATGLAAALVRELAAPYLVAMAAAALVERRRREGLAWLGALGVFVLALLAHGWAVNQHVLSSDAHSPGWLGLGGWPFLLRALQWNAILAACPAWVAFTAAPLALLGAATWRGALGARVGLVVLGYTAALLVFGRPENAYWGLILTPLLPLGLIGAPNALAARPPASTFA